MPIVGAMLSFLIWLYLLVLTARAVLSFVPLFVRGWQPRGAVRVLAETIYTVTDPPLRFIGRLVPPLRLGGVALDVGFLILYFGLTILQRVVLVAFS